MLFFYTLVSWIEIGLTIPSQMASEADFLHLKVDKKRMQCFIQTIAFFHLTIRILQGGSSHSFCRALRDFSYTFLRSIYLPTRD